MIRIAMVSLLATGCTNSGRVFTDLSGAWAGTVTIQQVPHVITATFEFVDDSYLDGTATVVEGQITRTFEMRRAEVYRRQVAMEMQTQDLVFNLDLDGDVGEGTFGGEATLTTACDPPQDQPCGWVAPFSITSVPNVATPANPPPQATPPEPPPPEEPPGSTGSTGSTGDTGTPG